MTALGIGDRFNCGSVTFGNYFGSVEMSLPL